MPVGRITSDSTSAANRCLPATSPTYPAIEMLGFEYEKVRPGSVKNMVSLTSRITSPRAPSPMRPYGTALSSHPALCVMSCSVVTAPTFFPLSDGTISPIGTAMSMRFCSASSASMVPVNILVTDPTRRSMSGVMRCRVSMLARP